MVERIGIGATNISTSEAEVAASIYVAVEIWQRTFVSTAIYSTVGEFALCISTLPKLQGFVEGEV